MKGKFVINLCVRLVMGIGFEDFFHEVAIRIC